MSLLVHLGITSNQRSIQFGYLLQQLVQGPQGPLVCLLESCQFLPEVLKGTGDNGAGFLIGAEVDGEGDERSGNITSLFLLKTL